MKCIQGETNREFICVFGGRNSDSEVTSSFLLYPISVIDGDFAIRPAISLNHNMSPREMPVMSEFGRSSILIMGGIDENKEVAKDSWRYNSDKQTFSKVDMKLDME